MKQFAVMYKYFMTVDLTQEDLDICEGYFQVNFGKAGGIQKVEDLKTLLMTDVKHKSLGGGKKEIATTTFGKMKRILTSKKLNIADLIAHYQSQFDVIKKQISTRGLKMLLSNDFNLSSYDADNLI